MQLNVTESPATSLRLPLLNLRWGGIFAGLAVGIAANLLLLLVGVSIGLGVFDVGTPDAEGATAAAMIWNIACMIVAAFVGGYVAARAAGLHRTSDGVLHGAVAWGATMLLSALLASTATSAAFGNLFSLGSGNQVSAAAGGAVMSRIQAGDRQAAVEALTSRLGLPADQAGRIVDQALIASGRPESASAEGREQAEQARQTATVVTSSLSAAVVLSLLAAIGGGLLGARGTRRSMGHIEKRQTATGDIAGL